MSHQHHYTDRVGYNGIVALSPWRFRAGQPPGPHPFGAYFTTLPPGTKKLAKRLQIPRTKIEFAFIFLDQSDLVPLRGRRGPFIFFSPHDYEVDAPRQVYGGRRQP
jgi:hypothetical protein